MPVTRTEARSRLLAFFDECGDHSLTTIDRDFPLFVLSTVIIERSVYVGQVIPAMGKLKLRFWNHEGVNLHSRDIRKAQGDFAWLQVPDNRQRFLTTLSELLTTLPFTLFITAINKRTHLQKYGAVAANPYDLALTFTMERVIHYLENACETLLPMVAEARGAKEDAELEAAFYRLMTQGTSYVTASRFGRLRCPLTFRRKCDNVCGTQLADLCAHPSARRILRPQQPNQAFNVVESHIYDRNGVRGWKVFP